MSSNFSFKLFSDCEDYLRTNFNIYIKLILEKNVQHKIIKQRAFENICKDKIKRNDNFLETPKKNTLKLLKIQNS